MIFLNILFWGCAFAVVHSYLLYPFFIQLMASGKKANELYFKVDEALPQIAVLLAVYNEEKVIEEKIKTTLETTYPISKIEFLIGSDSSTDFTNEIIKKYSSKYSQIKFYPISSRTGKAGIINFLAEKTNAEIIILTDANVFFTAETLPQLLKHFKNQQIALVAGNIIPRDLKHDGVSRQESFYQHSENKVKFREGVLWGAMMGAFGGCYAIRKSFFSPTPPKFIVDDLYITLAAIEKGGKAISEPSAICYEDVSNVMKEEFRRKSRIATGNFQIIKRFSNLLLPKHRGIAFAFLSHKILRWFGPFLIIAAYLISFALSFDSSFYKILFLIQTILFITPIFEWILWKLNIHLFGLRYISHFYVMNLALLNGFIKYLTGVSNNVWEPTKRNQ